MTLTWPLALLGLAAIPLLVLLERRRRRPRPQVWPSLLLWRAVADVELPSRRRAGSLLFYECAAVFLLVWAATGPVVRTQGGRRKVVALIDMGRHMMARLGDGRTALAATLEELERIDAHLHRVEVRGDLMRTAAAVSREGVVVLATSREDAAGPGYIVVGRAPDGFNVGIDAVQVRDKKLWFSLATDGEAREVLVQVGAARMRARTGRGYETEFAREISILDANDNYDGDNRCTLRRLALAVETDSDSPYLKSALKVGLPVRGTGEADLVIRTGGGEAVDGVVRGADCKVAPGIFAGLLLDECVWVGARTRAGKGLLTWRGRALAAWLDARTLWLGLPLDRDWDGRGSLAVLMDRAKRSRLPLAENEVVVGDAVASPAPGLVWTRGVNRPWSGELPPGARQLQETTGLRLPLALLAALILALYVRAMFVRT